MKPVSDLPQAETSRLNKRRLWPWAGVLLVAGLAAAGFLAVSTMSKIGRAIEGLGTWSTQMRPEGANAESAPSVEVHSSGGGFVTPAPRASEDVPSAATAETPPAEDEAGRVTASLPSLDDEQEAMRAELAEILEVDPETRAAVEALLNELGPDEIDEDLEFLRESLRSVE